MRGGGEKDGRNPRMGAGNHAERYMLGLLSLLTFTRCSPIRDAGGHLTSTCGGGGGGGGGGDVRGEEAGSGRWGSRDGVSPSNRGHEYHPTPTAVPRVAWHGVGRKEGIGEQGVGSWSASGERGGGAQVQGEWLHGETWAEAPHPATPTKGAPAAGGGSPSGGHHWRARGFSEKGGRVEGGWEWGGGGVGGGGRREADGGPGACPIPSASCTHLEAWQSHPPGDVLGICWHGLRVDVCVVVVVLLLKQGEKGEAPWVRRPPGPAPPCPRPPVFPPPLAPSSLESPR
jgi:hypothetical protein